MGHGHSSGNGWGTAVIILALLLFGAGAIAALGFAQTELTNPAERRAGAEQTKSEIARQEALSEIEISGLKELVQAEREAELARIEADARNYEAGLVEARRLEAIRRENELAAQAEWEHAKTTLILALGLGIAVVATLGACAVMVALLQRREAAIAQRAPPANQTVDGLQTPLWEYPEFQAMMQEVSRLRQQVDGPLHTNGGQSNGGIESANPR